MHIGKSPQVDLLAREGETLFLQSDELLHGHCRVRAWVARQQVHAEVKILENIPAEGDGKGHWGKHWHTEFAQLLHRLERLPRQYVYRATLDGPQDFTPYFRILLEPAPSDQIDDRRAARQVPRVPARSINFHEFKADLHDISDTGVGLDISVAVPRGHVLRFTLDPQDGDHKPFFLTAEVAWCKIHPNLTHYQAGAFFTGLSPQIRRHLGDYLDSLSAACGPS